MTMITRKMPSGMSGRVLTAAKGSEASPGPPMLKGSEASPRPLMVGRAECRSGSRVLVLSWCSGAVHDVSMAHCRRGRRRRTPTNRCGGSACASRGRADQTTPGRWTQTNDGGRLANRHCIPTIWPHVEGRPRPASVPSKSSQPAPARQRSSQARRGYMAAWTVAGHACASGRQPAADQTESPGWDLICSTFHSWQLSGRLVPALLGPGALCREGAGGFPTIAGSTGKAWFQERSQSFVNQQS